MLKGGIIGINGHPSSPIRSSSSDHAVRRCRNGLRKGQSRSTNTLTVHIAISGCSFGRLHKDAGKCHASNLDRMRRTDRVHLDAQLRRASSTHA